jgi:hypothetical protein
MIYILGVLYIDLGKSFPNSFIASLFDLGFCARHSRCTLMGFISTVYLSTVSMRRREGLGFRVLVDRNRPGQ